MKIIQVENAKSTVDVVELINDPFASTSGASSEEVAAYYAVLAIQELNCNTGKVDLEAHLDYLVECDATFDYQVALKRAMQEIKDIWKRKIEELKAELKEQEATLKNYKWDDKQDLDDAIFGEMDIVETFMQGNDLDDDNWTQHDYFRDLQHDMVNNYADDNGLE
jgi:hypothetical protein